MTEVCGQPLSSAEAEGAVCGGDREGLALTLVRLHKFTGGKRPIRNVFGYNV